MADGSYAGKVGWSAGREDWLDSESSKVGRYWRSIESGSGSDWEGRTIAGMWGGAGIGAGGNPFGGSRVQDFTPSFKEGTSQDPEGMLGAARRALWLFMEGGDGPNMKKLKVDRVWVYYQPRSKHAVKIPGHGWSYRDGGKRTPTGKRRGEYRQIRTEKEAKRARQSLFHWFMTQAESAAQIPFTSGVIKNPIEARHYYSKGAARFKPRLPQLQAEALREAAHWAIGDVAPGREFTAFREASAAEPGGSRRKGQAKREVTDAQAMRLGSHQGSIYGLSASVHVQSLMRNGDGTFINGVFQQTLREVNARVAQAYLEEVASLMRFHRPSTNNLIDATLDRRNRYPDDEL